MTEIRVTDEAWRQAEETWNEHINCGNGPEKALRAALSAAAPLLQVQAGGVDREALRGLMRDALNAYVNLGPNGYYNYLDSFLALLSPEETKCECEWTEDGPVPCDAHKGIVIPQATSAYSETVTLDVLLRLSENSTDGRLRDAIAMVRSALHDRVDALSTSGEVKP